MDGTGVLLLAASGLAREVIAAGAIDGIAGILDDDAGLHGTRVGGVEVQGPISDAGWRRERLLICAGSGRSRRAILARLDELGVEHARFAIAVHRDAVLAPDTRVGAGSIVLAGVVATADVRIGGHVVVMPNCTLTHDDHLADFATLAAGVALGGGVRVEEAAYLGMNASVRQNVAVGSYAVVGMGAAVLDDVPPGETWVGVPARRLERAGVLS